jgi:DUF4097 and DUF4098 domain-containing protein YvlB
MFRSAALAATVALALGPSPAAQNRPIQLEAADCSQTNMMFGDYEVGRAVQHARVPVSGTLELRPDANGGVRIERGGGGEFAITACIGAGAASRAEAQAAADSVRLEVSGTRVRVRGAEDRAVRTWSVQLIVLAPDGASVDVATMNGPIGVSGLSGTFTLRASNGPISLSGVDGEVKANASNGPISIEGGRGTFDVETANGPIGVRLTGSRWDGSLTARAGNGPLTLSLPANYQSGVEVSSSGRSPWSCRAAACTNATGDWDDRARTLRLGGGPVAVHLSTVNGPVTINER